MIIIRLENWTKYNILRWIRVWILLRVLSDKFLSWWKYISYLTFILNVNGTFIISINSRKLNKIISESGLRIEILLFEI